MESMTFARGPMIAITVLRVLVGWHFLYEGLSKLTAPSFTAAGYLKQAKGPLAGAFHSLAARPDLLGNADLITMWGLTLVGALLILGLFTRLASLARIAFVLMFYLAIHPDWLLLRHPDRRQLPDRQQEPGRGRRPRRDLLHRQRPLRRTRSHPVRAVPSQAAAGRSLMEPTPSCAWSDTLGQARRCPSGDAVASALPGPTARNLHSPHIKRPPRRRQVIGPRAAAPRRWKLACCSEER